MSILGAAAITAGASALGQGFNAYQAGRMNKRGERFAREMYDKQRGHAVSDWERQNAYNDPSSQMQRLKDAGLNPNLVYGNGADAQSTAPVRSSSASQPNYQPPKMDTGSIALQAMQMKQLQSNIARTDAETASIRANTMEQDFKNKMLTPEMFEQLYNSKKWDAQSRSLTLGHESDIANANADIKDLERQNLNLLSGRDKLSSRDSYAGTNKPNLVLQKAQADISAIAKRTTGQELQNKIQEYEVKLINSLNINKQTAQSIVSNLFKIILMRLGK